MQLILLHNAGNNSSMFYPFDDLLEVAHVEYILDMPEIAGHD